jgi:hypothetical protein
MSLRRKASRLSFFEPSEEKTEEDINDNGRLVTKYPRISHRNLTPPPLPTRSEGR